MTPSSLPTPANSARSTACIVNVVRRRFFTTRGFAGLLAGAVSFVALDLSAAPPPAAVAQVQVVNTAAQPAQVEVVKPVDVQGSVETLNDAIHQPYFQNRTGAFDASTAPLLTLNFYVPAGKRLVIETITVQMLGAPGDQGYVLMAPNAARPNEFLSLGLQSQGVFSGFASSRQMLVGTHSIRLRVDGPTNSAVTTPTFSITGYSSMPTMGAQLWAAVSGYLVDL